MARDEVPGRLLHRLPVVIVQNNQGLVSQEGRDQQETHEGRSVVVGTVIEIDPNLGGILQLPQIGEKFFKVLIKKINLLL